MAKKKAAKKKNSEEKRGIKPVAVLTAPDFFGVTTLTSTREENLFPSRFFVPASRNVCHPEWSVAKPKDPAESP
jgi:hypothetical protein